MSTWYTHKIYCQDPSHNDDNWQTLVKDNNVLLTECPTNGSHIVLPNSAGEPVQDGLSGQVKRTDGNNNVTWQTPIIYHVTFDNNTIPYLEINNKNSSSVKTIIYRGSNLDRINTCLLTCEINGRELDFKIVELGGNNTLFEMTGISDTDGKQIITIPKAVNFDQNLPENPVPLDIIVARGGGSGDKPKLYTLMLY